MSDTPKTASRPKEKFTINYVLNQIEQVMRDNDHINHALEQLAQMPKSDPGDLSGQAKAMAISDIVKCRETTNQQALRLYEKMYNDLNPKQESTKNKVIDMVSEIAKGTSLCESEQGMEILSNMLDTIRHIG